MGVEVSFPKEPETMPASPATGGLHAAIVKQATPDELGFVCQWKMENALGAGQEAEALKGMKDGMAKAAKGTIISEKEINVQGFAGMEVIMSVGQPASITMRVQALISGKRVIVLNVVGKDADAVRSEAAERFFASFKATGSDGGKKDPPKKDDVNAPPNGWQTYTLPDFGIQVSFPKVPNERTPDSIVLRGNVQEEPGFFCSWTEVSDSQQKNIVESLNNVPGVKSISKGDFTGLETITTHKKFGHTKREQFYFSGTRMITMTVVGKSTDEVSSETANRFFASLGISKSRPQAPPRKGPGATTLKNVLHNQTVECHYQLQPGKKYELTLTNNGEPGAKFFVFVYGGGTQNSSSIWQSNPTVTFGGPGDPRGTARTWHIQVSRDGPGPPASVVVTVTEK
jgi:hypothetical protein